MKNIMLLSLTFLTLSSCSNMQSDIDKVCELTTQTMEMMPKVFELGMKSEFGDESSKEEAQKELDSLQTETEQMVKELESIKSKYDEDEFQASFIENCEAAKKLLEMGNSLEGIGKALED